jgi:hypothetical protein
MPRHPPTGALWRWSDISEKNWDVLLVGNGLSINVYPYFAYTSLYGEANDSAYEGGLGLQERAVFEAFDTTNFEIVLAKLRDWITLTEVIGGDSTPCRRLFAEVQAALGRTVRRVHVPYSEVPVSTLKTIKAWLQGFEAVFSTSYDLLLYWARVHGDDFSRFCDCFWANGRNEFDPKDCKVRADQIPIYYLHGALHLVVNGSGITRKLIKENGPLLDQFGQANEEDPGSRPLLISEGSHRDKLRAIEGNDYLAHTYDKLKEASKPLLVFGHSLGEQDQHLIEAINSNPDRRVAISMVKGDKEALRKEQVRISSGLRTETVFFFDAATHPLGSKGLEALSPRERVPGRWRPSR